MGTYVPRLTRVWQKGGSGQGHRGGTTDREAGGHEGPRP